MYDKNEQTKKKIVEEKQAAKRARKVIEEYEQKIEDAERNIKAYENEFIERLREIDTKKRQLDEEIVVVGNTPPLLANQNEEAEEGQLLNDIAAIELGGDSNGTAQKFRTRIVPEFSRDLTNKWRWYDIKLNCYTAMYHAENKSLEELRIEDYISNRKVAEQLAIEKTNQGAVQNNNHPLPQKRL
ncbi:unnamed protein product, partial [Oikopleura dioica]